jgi:hypothetical protein
MAFSREFFRLQDMYMFMFRTYDRAMPSVQPVRPCSRPSEVIRSQHMPSHRGWRALLGHLAAGNGRNVGGGRRARTFDLLIGESPPYGDRLVANPTWVKVSPTNPATQTPWNCGGALTLQYWCSPFETVWSGAISPCGTWLIYGGSVVLLINLFTGSSTLLLQLGLVEVSEPRVGTQAATRQLPVCGCCAFSYCSTLAVASKGASLALLDVGARACSAVLQAGVSGNGKLVACAVTPTYAAACDSEGAAFVWAHQAAAQGVSAQGQPLPRNAAGRIVVPCRSIPATVGSAEPRGLYSACSAAPLSGGAGFCFGGTCGLKVWTVDAGEAEAGGDLCVAPLPATFAGAGHVQAISANSALLGGSAAVADSSVVRPGLGNATPTALVSISDDGASIWAMDGSCLGHIPAAGEPLRGACFGLGGRQLLLLSGGSDLRLFDVARDGTPLLPPHQLLFGGRHVLSFCAISPCGEWVLALGLTPLQAVELIAQHVNNSSSSGATSRETVSPRAVNLL